jgi:hypothetical protein
MLACDLASTRTLSTQCDTPIADFDIRCHMPARYKSSICQYASSLFRFAIFKSIFWISVAKRGVIADFEKTSS